MLATHIQPHLQPQVSLRGMRMPGAQGLHAEGNCHEHPKSVHVKTAWSGSTTWRDGMSTYGAAMQGGLCMLLDEKRQARLDEVLLLLTSIWYRAADDLGGDLATKLRLHYWWPLVVTQVLVHQILHFHHPRMPFIAPCQRQTAID